jgi:hypothetical protein
MLAHRSLLPKPVALFGYAKTLLGEGIQAMLQALVPEDLL